MKQLFWADMDSQNTKKQMPFSIPRKLCLRAANNKSDSKGYIMQMSDWHEKRDRAGLHKWQRQKGRKMPQSTYYTLAFSQQD